MGEDAGINRRGWKMAKVEKVDSNGLRKFGFKDVFAYGLGDFGCNMSFALKSFLIVYWTQFMGIDSILMASLLLIVQVWDAINDPIIGAVVDADTHKYRRNKFLTYVWAGSIGLLVAGALCYIPWPSAPYVIKCILFVAGYMLWDAFYTVANVPYGSLLSLISNDPVERTKLSTGRSVGSMVGALTTGILLPFFIYDASNNLRGEVMFGIALVMGVLGFIAFQYMIRNTVVRVQSAAAPSTGGKKATRNPLVGIGHFLRNRAAIGATIAPVGTFISMYGSQTASIILFQSYFQNAQISGLVSMLSYVGLFAFIPFASKIVDKWGKKESVTVGVLFSTVAYAALLVLPITPDSNGLMIYIACLLVAAVGLGLSQCVSWSFMADAMDYEEWKFGTRNEGTTYAMHSFFRKLAQGIGPSLGLVLATMLGYNEALGAAQTAATAFNMRMLAPAMLLVGNIIMLIGYGLVYNLDKKTVAQMERDLGKKRESAVNLNAALGED